jgi:hypothetical protein
VNPNVDNNSVTNLDQDWDFKPTFVFMKAWQDRPETKHTIPFVKAAIIVRL